MDCNVNEHDIAINYDFDYACKKCGCLFVTGLRIAPYYHEYSQKLIKQNLVARFDGVWRVEWQKLLATRQIVRGIRMANLRKDCIKIQLSEYKVYTLEDFYKPIEEWNFMEF